MSHEKALLHAVSRLRNFRLPQLAAESGVPLELVRQFVQNCEWIERSGQGSADECIWLVTIDRAHIPETQSISWQRLPLDEKHGYVSHQMLQDSLDMLTEIAGSNDDEQISSELHLANLELRSIETNFWDRQCEIQQEQQRETAAIDTLRGRLRSLSAAVEAPWESDALTDSSLWTCLFDWTCPVPAILPAATFRTVRDAPYHEQLVAAALQNLPDVNQDDAAGVIRVAARVLYVWGQGDPAGQRQGRMAVAMRLRNLLGLPQCQQFLPVVTAVALVLRLDGLAADIFRALLVDPTLSRLGSRCRQLFLAAFARIARETSESANRNDAAAACLYLVGRPDPVERLGVLVAAALLSLEADAHALVKMLCGQNLSLASFAGPAGEDALVRTLSNAMFVRRHQRDDSSQWQSVLLSDAGRLLLSTMVEPANDAARMLPREGAYELRPSLRVALRLPQSAMFELQVAANSDEQMYLGALVQAHARTRSVGPTPFSASVGAKWARKEAG